MNGTNTTVRTSNEAITKLQQKRNAVGRSTLLLVLGAFLLIIPPIGVGVILFICWRVQKLRAEMKDLYKDAFVREPLANNFDNVVYEPKEGFTKENIEAFRLCEMGNRWWSEDYIRATYKGVDFEIAEVNVREVYEHSDERTTSENYFQGRMMVFNFPNKLVNTVAVYSRKFKHRALNQKVAKDYKVELESMQFNKEFDVYSADQQDAFYLITPHFMERLLLLSGKYESIAMNVVGNRVFLGFNEPDGNVFDANIEVGKLDIDKEMAKVQGEIDDIKVLIAVVLNLK